MSVGVDGLTWLRTLYVTLWVSSFQLNCGNVSAMGAAFEYDRQPSLAVSIDEVALDLDSLTGEAEHRAGVIFASKCHTTMRQMLIGSKFDIHTELLTKNQTWGLIWRADYGLIVSDGNQYLNRVVCSELDNGELVVQIAIGQKLPELRSHSELR